MTSARPGQCLRGINRTALPRRLTLEPFRRRRLMYSPTHAPGCRWQRRGRNHGSSRVRPGLEITARPRRANDCLGFNFDSRRSSPYRSRTSWYRTNQQEERLVFQRSFDHLKTDTRLAVLIARRHHIADEMRRALSLPSSAPLNSISTMAPTWAPISFSPMMLPSVSMAIVPDCSTMPPQRSAREWFASRSNGRPELTLTRLYYPLNRLLSCCEVRPVARKGVFMARAMSSK